jgi:predicted ATPase
MSKIKIKNFGPIKEGYQENDGWMDVEKVTVFIGNQGSGKSTVAKLISTFTWLEKALFTEVITKEDITENNNFKDNFCHYHRLKNYFWYTIDSASPASKNHEAYKEFMKTQSKPDSEIHFKGSKYEFHYYEYALTIIPIETNNNYSVPKIMYVPSERNFLSAIEAPNFVKGLPGPLYEFLSEYDRSLEELSESLNLPIGKLKLFYRRETKTVHILGDNYSIRLLDASSGLQSLVPLYLVSLNLSSSIGKESDSSKKDMSLEEEKRIKAERQKIKERYKDDSLSDRIDAQKEVTANRKRACFINIIEEPEQNLFPSSQRQMLNSLLEFNNMNVGNELIMTTHSPYIINFLSIAIQGNELCKKIKEKKEWEKLKEEFEKIVPEKSIISASDVVIYELDEDKGIIKKLPSFEGIPSDKNYLNQSLAEGNQLFDSLLEIEQGL